MAVIDPHGLSKHMIGKQGNTLEQKVELRSTHMIYIKIKIETKIHKQYIYSLWFTTLEEFLRQR